MQYIFLNMVHGVVNYRVRVQNHVTQTGNLTIARYVWRITGITNN